VAGMELGNGWNLPAPILRKLRMLEYLADYGNASVVPPLPEWAQPGTDRATTEPSDTVPPATRCCTGSTTNTLPDARHLLNDVLDEHVGLG
jgi:hypothetical protein